MLTYLLANVIADNWLIFHVQYHTTLYNTAYRQNGVPIENVVVYCSSSMPSKTQACKKSKESLWLSLHSGSHWPSCEVCSTHLMWYKLCPAQVQSQTEERTSGSFWLGNLFEGNPASFFVKLFSSVQHSVTPTNERPLSMSHWASFMTNPLLRIVLVRLIRHAVYLQSLDTVMVTMANTNIRTTIHAELCALPTVLLSRATNGDVVQSMHTSSPVTMANGRQRCL